MGSFRVALLLALVPAVALAQPKNTQKAGDLVKQAIAKSQAGDHVAAIDLYLQAYQLVPMAALLSNVGSEYQQAGKPIDAIKYFCRYLDEDPAGTNASYATAQVKVLQTQLGNQVDDKNVCKPIVPPPPPPPPVEKSPPPPPPPPAEPESSASGMRIGGLAVGAAGVVVLAVGGYYAYKGYSLSSQISDHKMGNWPGTFDGVPIDQWNEAGATYNSRAWGFSIAGVALTGVGVALYIVGSRHHTEESPHALVIPVAGPDGLGLAAAGRF